MKVGIVTDSMNDLPPELASKYGIVIVPGTIFIDEKPYRSGIDIFPSDIEDLIKKNNKAKSLYDNFILNAIIGFFLPFVIFYFTGNVLYIFIISLLFRIIVYSERENNIFFIFPQSACQNLGFRILFISGLIKTYTMSTKKKLKIHSKEDPNEIKIP
ncbi:MAG: DegV family protein [Candidatus Thorarchaeota archaeon]